MQAHAAALAAQQAAIAAQPTAVQRIVNFDGTNDYRFATSLTYPTVGKQGTFSCWFRNNAASWASGPFIMAARNAGSVSFEVTCTSTGRLGVYMRNSSNAVIVSCIPPSNSFVVGTTYHFVASWDLTAPELMMAINGAQVTVTKSTLTNDTPRTQDRGVIGADPSGNNKWNGYLCDVFFDNQRYIDLSVLSNRQKFYNGGWVSLGSDGSTPLGAQPAIFFSGTASEWGANKGSATGSWAVNGTLDDV